ncbi:hypothetical protein ASG04_02900 [Curtobacterium sp. Leaf183]|uniref:hypothetical protein n=1 Tax=Curtobacterium sp. Leaf183 TaxID=1736291 RepID=UPI0007000BAD|nr:hypothetical protein [Curtobacterium sp. Leaf183]KQS14786.1 hypothetical protein ASG04_02900 [Curtobacterium sp. Leaf183]
MQSMEPMPGNPWPHDMVITITDDSHALLDLLWVRQAWELEPVGDDLPPLLIDTPAVEHPTADTPIAAWTAAWPGLWHACLRHAALPRDTTVVERLSSPTLDQDSRHTLLTQLIGPSLEETFGDDAFTPGRDAWNSARFEERTAPGRLRAQPEHTSLDALFPAWRAGLTTIIELPCQGAFTRRVGDHALVVTTLTRADPDAYAAALRSFA